MCLMTVILMHSEVDPKVCEKWATNEVLAIGPISLDEEKQLRHDHTFHSAIDVYPRPDDDESFGGCGCYWYYASRENTIDQIEEDLESAPPEVRTEFLDRALNHRDAAIRASLALKQVLLELSEHTTISIMAYWSEVTPPEDEHLLGFNEFGRDSFEFVPATLYRIVIPQ